MSKPKRILKGDAVAYARRLWEDGRVRPTGYCKDRLHERNLSMPDIEEALFSPECVCTAVTTPRGRWRYRLEGCIEEKQREQMALVLEFDVENATVRLITVFSRGEV